MSLEHKTDVLGNNAVIAQGNVEAITASVTLSYEDSGTVFLVGTDALVITLLPTKVGVTYTFVNSGADGNNLITLDPNADDAIFGTVANAAADSVSGGALDKDLVNTKATAIKGDSLTIVGDGVDGWYIVGGVGIWASEA